jgi:hypothetical protein
MPHSRMSQHRCGSPNPQLSNLEEKRTRRYQPRRDHHRTQIEKREKKLCPISLPAATIRSQSGEIFRRGDPQDRTYALIDRGTRALTDRLIANAGTDPKRWVELIQHLGSVPPDIRTAAFSKLSATATEISDNQVRNEIWNGLRKFISRHRSFPDTDWALPTEEIDRIERIYEQFRPSDPVLQRSWLFQNGVQLLDGRNAENWEQRDQEVFDLRKQAMKELLMDEGIIGVRRLIQLAGAAYPVGFAYGTVSTSTEEVEQTLLKASLPMRLVIGKLLRVYAALPRSTRIAAIQNACLSRHRVSIASSTRRRTARNTGFSEMSRL